MSTTIDLKFPINRDTIRRGHQGVTYSTAQGEGSKVAAIEEHPSGWRIVVDNQVSYVVPHAHVDGVEIKPDHAPETAQLPGYAERVASGFKCLTCGKVCPTLHGLKTHHGSHDRE